MARQGPKVPLSSGQDGDKGEPPDALIDKKHVDFLRMLRHFRCPSEWARSGQLCRNQIRANELPNLGSDCGGSFSGLLIRRPDEFKGLMLRKAVGRNGRINLPQNNETIHRNYDPTFECARNLHHFAMNMNAAFDLFAHRFSTAISVHYPIDHKQCCGSKSPVTATAVTEDQEEGN